MLEKVSWIKKFSQRAQRRKDIKEYEVYQKTDYSVFRKKRYSKTLCALKKLGIFAYLARIIDIISSIVGEFVAAMLNIHPR
jgi:hypothetical protein